MQHMASAINAEIEKATGRRFADHVRAAGGMLLQVKASLNHGEFGPWMEANLGCSVRQAQRLMKLAKNGENCC